MNRWRSLRQFTPNWFCHDHGHRRVGPGSGCCPYRSPGSCGWPKACRLLTVLLFGLFSLLFVARLLLFRDTLWPMLITGAVDVPGRDSHGLVQVVNGLLLFAEPVYGAVVVQLAHGLWWLALGLALGGAGCRT